MSSEQEQKPNIVDLLQKIDLFDDEVTWKDLGVPDHVIQLLDAAQLRTPTKTQSKALKSALVDKKHSGLLEAPTGTGKTITFLTLILASIAADVKYPQAVIVAPTKILSRQIYDVTTRLVKDSGITATLCLAETELSSEEKINPSAQIVIGTAIALRNNFAGKVVRKGKLQTRVEPIFRSDDVKVVVIDEADFYMESENNANDMTKLLETLPPKVRRFLFSATMPADVVKAMIKEWINEDSPYFNEKVDIFLGNSIQFYVSCNAEEKVSALNKIVNLDIYRKGVQAIIFCNTKKFVDECYETMTNNGYKCSKYHSDMTSDERAEAFEKFKSGKNNCLISTNVLARGIDISSIRLVINYSPPTKEGKSDMAADPTIYTHRIGRGGRFGRATVAITFCDKNTEEEYMQGIIKYVEEKYADQKRTEKIITHLTSINEIKANVTDIMRRVDKEIDEEISEKNKRAKKRNDSVEDVTL